MYTTRVIKRTHNIFKDNTHTHTHTHTHTQDSLFTLLPSGRRYRSVKARTTALTNSFYPQAFRPLNTAISPHTLHPPLLNSHHIQSV